MGRPKKETPEKKQPEKVTIRLSNQQLFDLNTGLDGLLGCEADTDVLWNADNILERIAPSIRTIERARERIILKYVKRDGQQEPVREVDHLGRVGHVIPKENRPLLEDELEKFMEQVAPQGITFPASWQIPYEEIPRKFVGKWLKWLRPVVVREQEEEEEEENTEETTDAA
jgi:hypothetical protein